MVLEKISTDGLVPTLEAVREQARSAAAAGLLQCRRRWSPSATGVAGFAVGDRVVSNGKHAEIVSVPVNLCARVPDAVERRRRGVHACSARSRCRAFGSRSRRSAKRRRDRPRPDRPAHGAAAARPRLPRARPRLRRRTSSRWRASFGAEHRRLEPARIRVAAAKRFSRGRGVDAVLITAATPSSEPVHQAALMCRKRGRIVLVGVAGLELSRADFYEKELTFQVSCSYGPGRYDPATKSVATTIPSASCAGPSSATSRRCST